MPRLQRIRKSFVRQLLDPVPGLESYPEIHRYRLNGEWLPWSVNQVLSFDMSPIARDRIEATKHGPDGWLERGKTIHACLEHKLLTGQQQGNDKWAAWLEPLYDCDLFKDAETLATEYVVCDKLKRVGGTFDFLLRKGDSVILGDLKTVSSKKGVSSRKPATAQLAAYQSMMASLHSSLVITDLVTVVSGPERTRVIWSDAKTAWVEWIESWGRFSCTQPDW